MADDAALSTSDKFEIFEQMNLHQQSTDNDASRHSALKYVDLYWPEEGMTVNDLGRVTFSGHDELKRMYDYAHIVFPIAKWSHAMGPFSILGSGDRATATWR